jgi:putative nucleotidyltransferase with HDIG domain
MAHIFPISDVVRDRLLEALRAERPAGELVHLIEGDMALLANVLRLGNRRRFDRGRVDSVAAALDGEAHHGRAVQGAAHRIAEALGFPDLGRVAAVAGPHDIGKLLDPDDHARAGAEWLRAWGLPERVAGAVERHHDPEAHEEAAIVGLADQLVHFHLGSAVDGAALAERPRAGGPAG